MSDTLPKPEELAQVDYQLPSTGWMDTPTDFKRGNWLYPAKPEHLEYLS